MAGPRSKVQIKFRLPLEQARILRALAALHGKSLSKTVEEALVRFVKANEGGLPSAKPGVDP